MIPVADERNPAARPSDSRAEKRMADVPFVSIARAARRRHRRDLRSWRTAPLPRRQRPHASLIWLPARTSVEPRQSGRDGAGFRTAPVRTTLATHDVVDWTHLTARYDAASRRNSLIDRFPPGNRSLKARDWLGHVNERDARSFDRLIESPASATRCNSLMRASVS